MSLAYQHEPNENGGESKTSTSVTVPEELFHKIKEWAKEEKHNIHKERTYDRNMSFAFGNMGGFGEELVLLMLPGALGSASKGGAAHDIITEWDENFKTIRAKEVKAISLNGTKPCLKCGLKAPVFQTKCLKCTRTNFLERVRKTAADAATSAGNPTPSRRYSRAIQLTSDGWEQIKRDTADLFRYGDIKLTRDQINNVLFPPETGEIFGIRKDSRAGINAKTHNEVVVEQFIVDEYLIIICDCDEKTLKGTLTCFKIKSKNRFFNIYTLNQLEKGDKNTCNLCPYKYDFYASGPIKVFEFEVDFNTLEVDVNYYNPNNEAIEDFPTKILTKKQKEFYDVKEKQSVIKYSEIESQLVLKNKCMGKPRGTCSRN